MQTTAFLGDVVHLRAPHAVMTIIVAAQVTIQSAMSMQEPVLTSFGLHCIPFCLQQSKDNPLGVKALKRTAAKPHWAIGGGKRSSS
ncbi:hypothetical protein GBA52_015624 [Prunus armeniaca]|nr:hypothetical protein GBA52_015624 [Prunus armeniaca]